MIRLDIIGHLGKDAETRTVGSQQVINFSVAHTEKWKDATGQQKEKTIWVECARWVAPGGSTAIAQYLKKGTQVFCTGTPEPDAYSDSNGPVGKIKLNVLNVQLLGSKDNSGTSAETAPAPPPPAPKWDADKKEWIKPSLVGGKWVFPGEDTAGGSDDLPF